MAVVMKEVFEIVDSMDADGFANLFTELGSFRFANATPVSGHAEIASSVETFFGGIRGLLHTIHDTWELDDTIICEVEADYIRLDGTEVDLPAVTIARCEGDLIADYRIYMDINPLFGEPSPRVSLELA